MREILAHKLRQFERDGSQSATMIGKLVHKPERDREWVGAIVSQGDYGPLLQKKG